MQKTSTVVFCNALPVTKQAFEEGLADPKRDFVKHFVKDRKTKNAAYDWPAYRLQLVQPYETMKRTYSERGIEFVDHCTWEAYKDSVERSENKVIILFSHCINNGTPEEVIEYFDHMVSSESIVQILPVQYESIFEFAVCQSIYLHTKTSSIKMKGPLGTSRKPIPLTIWLYLYTETFYKMKVNGLDFIDALDDVFRDAENRIKKTKL